MLSIDEVARRLEDRNLTKVSEKTGLSYPTVLKVAKRLDGDVMYETIKKLSDYLEQEASA